ncbi:nuclear transport factor 2 family protein [Streptomyces sp. NPDC056987]|uniref:nuclear transport factor 2 family protein n=1 Tax=Streptomyces sp. NPDC056987 TaxID=3345988 RepID=UPI003631E293
MCRWFVRRNVRAAFAALSRGEMSLLDTMAPDVHHAFPGRGALGGERTTRDDVAAWLARLHRVLPGLQFQVRAVAVDGWPWHTTVGVEWTNEALLPDGSMYTNTGAHVLTLRNGKIVAFHAYLHDVEAIDDALDRVAASGVGEAAAPAIVSSRGVPGPGPGWPE